MIIESHDELVSHFIPQFMLNFEIELAEVLILKVPDAILNRVSGTSEEESHVIVENIRQIFHPRTGNESHVSLKIKLGQGAYLYSQSAYTLTSWMIDMGGISKSFYFGGMIIAHIVALRMYKAALISNIYMVQDEENYKK